MVNKKKQIGLLIASFSCIFISTLSCKAEQRAEKRIAKKIAKEKGVLKPDDVWQWNTSSKDLPKDWIKIDNKYFSAFYDPHCFSIEGEGGEEDPKIAPSVLFRRKRSCPSFKENYGDSNSVNIEYYPYSVKTLEGASSAEYPLVRQRIKINNIDSISLGGLMDVWNESKDTYDVQMRWQLFVICKNKTYRMVIDVPPGKPTMDLVEKNDYLWPEDFKGIISTFKCK